MFESVLSYFVDTSALLQTLYIDWVKYFQTLLLCLPPLQLDVAWETFLNQRRKQHTLGNLPCGVGSMNKRQRELDWALPFHLVLDTEAVPTGRGRLSQQSANVSDARIVSLAYQSQLLLFIKVTRLKPCFPESLAANSCMYNTRASTS